jgi:hypothetical protein
MGIVLIVSGVAILKGLQWGRLLFFVCGAVPIVLTILSWLFHKTDTVSAVRSLLPMIMLYAVAIVFLTRPLAAKFFKDMSKPVLNLEANQTSSRVNKMASPKTIKKSISILLLILGASSVLLGIFLCAFYVGVLLSGHKPLHFDLIITWLGFLSFGVLIGLGGTFLWGWERRRKVFGNILIIVSSFQLFIALNFLFVMPEKPKQFHEGFQIALGTTPLIVQFCFSVLLMLIGILLVIKQVHIEKKQV